MSDNSYACAMCGETFAKDRPDEEALAEAAERYEHNKEVMADNLTLVCDDCFQKMEAAYPASHFMEDRSAGIERRINLPDRTQ